jgi:superfamily II DNA/RNA helicase
VLVPTRELAQQVAAAPTPAARALDLRVTAVFGGASIGPQIEQLQGGVDVAVATPGWLLDLLERDAMRLDSVVVAVVDEADRMADLGFLPAVTPNPRRHPAEPPVPDVCATLDRGSTRWSTAISASRRRTRSPRRPPRLS